MPLQIKTTAKYVPRPKCLIYGDPGDGKTTLASTVETPGERDVLYAFTEGGVQTIANLDLPYVDLRHPADYVELVSMLKNGKPEPDQLGIRVGSKLFRGLCIDLHSHLVQLNLIDMVKDAKASNNDRDIDDPSQYEYKKLNFRMLRQIGELAKLPLKYLIFTAYVEKRVDRTTGALLESKPSYVGTQIWQTVAGQMDYVFRVQAPISVKDAAKYRTIRTQPSQNVYAKARIPAVPGNLPLPSEIKFELGHTTLLRKIFDKMEDYITSKQKLVPQAATPEEIVETAEETPAV